METPPLVEARLRVSGDNLIVAIAFSHSLGQERPLATGSFLGRRLPVLAPVATARWSPGVRLAEVGTHRYGALRAGELRRQPQTATAVHGGDARGRLHTGPLALAWLLHKARHILLIPGTTSMEHLREDLAAVDVELSADVVAKAEALIYQGTVRGNRYSDQNRSEVDTEEL